MKLDVADLENGITEVRCQGALTAKVPLRSTVSSSKFLRRRVVDLSQVTVIDSLGIRTLVIGSKATANNGGKMVLLNPQPNVEQVLRTTHLDTVMPIIHDSAEIVNVFGA